jgi:hypothetical protein
LDKEKKRVADLKEAGVTDPEQLKARPKEDLMRMTDFAYEENKEPIKKDFIGRMKLIRKH